MPNIKLYTSNRFEILADQLADTVREPLKSPLKPEFIVVQSIGMERWISMQLAERLGIWANCRYLFPNQVVEEIFKQIIPGLKDERVFDTDVIAWKIMNILPECLPQKGFESLRDYLSNNDYFRAFQLSSRIADTFDQYLTYRPEMILDWDRGKGDTWQAELWRLLMSETQLLHPPALREIFFERIKEPANIDAGSLPERISVFGISSMPVYHIEVLAAISDHIPVNIFFMNPSKEYWADIYPEKNIARTMGKYKDDITSRELHLEKGNSLLASMGKMGADFFSILMKYDAQEFPAFAQPEEDSLLHYIQADIMSMIDRGASNGDGRVEFSEDDIRSDASIRAHSCHSPMREVEVLYDNLLDMFNSDPELEPRDVLVMTPDIGIYSPYISAIFSDPPDEERRIPFSIADRSVRKDSLLADIFFAVLDLKEKRFGAARVLDILEYPDVRSKFNLTAGDLKLIRGWIRDTNISWGIDGEDRGKLGLPEFDENTWKAGIERMLLGYAMPGNDEFIFQDILPYDHIEGSGALVLGRFIEYFNSLISISETISRLHTLSSWSEILRDIQDKIFDSGEAAENAQIIRDAAVRLAEIERDSGFHEELELRIIKTWLEDHLNQERMKGGFLTGGVTFCEMLPMRSIPFKIICLIGMNDDAFPRTPTAIGFDLIARDPRPGDRSLRSDDKYIFLESIISARKRLYISYAGQSIQDNSEIPPSVVVSELIDYIRAGFRVKNADIKDYICIKHPLQSFSHRYFKDDENLFSYSEVNCRAGKAAISGRKEAAGFVSAKLSESYEPQKEGKIIALNDFVKFFGNPAKHLLTTRLGIYLNEKTDVLDEREPFDLGGLEKYYIEDFMCSRYIADRGTEDLYKILRARGMLPHGVMGEAAFKSLVPGIKNFSDRIKKIAGEDRLPPLEIDIDISGYNLSGRLENIWPRGMIQYRYADAKAKDRISAWIAHLALNASGEKAYPMNSMLICRDASWEMEPLGSTDILKELLEIYLKGKNELLSFFPETSLEYASSMLKKGSREEALRLAEKKWMGYVQGEGDNPYYYLCFKKTNPFNKDFAETSLRIFEPILNNQKKI